MTAEERNALNQRIAIVMGWKCYRVTDYNGKVWFEWGKEGFSRDQLLSIYSGGDGFGTAAEVSAPTGENPYIKSQCPKFCTDPAAADLVLSAMMERGWGVREEYEPMETPLRGGAITRVCVYLSKSEVPEVNRALPSEGLPRFAVRCIAFLAAHDAQEVRP